MKDGLPEEQGNPSFLYLRRVLENIEKSKQLEFESHNVKFNEKIEILKNYISDSLTENKCIY